MNDVLQSFSIIKKCIQIVLVLDQELMEVLQADIP